MLDTLLICLAVLAFLAIVLEDAIHVDKAKSTLFLGTLSWILLFTLGHDHQTVSTAFSENILDIASLWLFLFAAMTFVAYLNQHGMVDPWSIACCPPTCRKSPAAVRRRLCLRLLLVLRQHHHHAGNSRPDPVPAAAREEQYRWR